MRVVNTLYSGNVDPQGRRLIPALPTSARVRPVFRYPLVTRYVGPSPAQNRDGPNTPTNFVLADSTTFHSDHVEWIGDFLLSPGRLQ